MTSITLPDGVTSIGGFSGCTSLTSITIPDGVTEIGMWAFSNCTSLTSITIPDSVTEMGMWAFENCTSLSEVYCYATEPPTLNNSFASNIATLYVPAKCGTKYKQSDWGLYFDNIIEMD